jgi:hypothetical protein
MAVTEQVDALRALGASPLRKLVLPRVVAVTTMLPLLTMLTDFLGMIGGLFIAVFEIKIGASFYLSTVMQSTRYNDILHGLCKTPSSLRDRDDRPLQRPERDGGRRGGRATTVVPVSITVPRPTFL